jgi:hypothetical protein
VGSVSAASVIRLKFDSGLKEMVIWWTLAGPMSCLDVVYSSFPKALLHR